MVIDSVRRGNEKKESKLTFWMMEVHVWRQKLKEKEPVSIGKNGE